MTQFKVEHNPFFNDTKIWVSDQKTSDEKFSNLKNKRLVDIVDYIPQAFFEDCNNDNIVIHFIGRTYEYEDLLYACNNYNIKNGTNITIKHSKKYDNIDITRLKDFEKLLKKSPIKEISQNDDLINRFLNKLSTDFEVAVVATMSSGKSTLINSMLGQSILPARNEATTAKIFSIRDDDNTQGFSLELLDKKNKRIKLNEGTLQEQLEEANSREDVHEIKLHGDIPNISSSVANLVLLDTPGPNNAQNHDHKEVTYKLIKDNEKNPLIIYVLNAQQLTTDGVNDLLEEISDTIKLKNSSQNHDRFLFVLNKADGLEEDEVSKMISDTKVFLEKFSIKNPKIFPLSSYSALCCRKSANELSLSRKEKAQLRDAEDIVYDGVSSHFFEKYAPLSKQQLEILQDRIEQAKKDDEWLIQAEIHSGIQSLEMAIDDYVNKYAIPMKIHDAFMEIEKAVNIEIQRDELINALQKSQKDNQEQKKQLEDFSKKISSKRSVEIFKKKIGTINISHKSVKKEMQKLEKSFNNILKKNIFHEEMEIDKAERELESINKTISNLEISIRTTLDSEVHLNIKEKIEEIIKEFHAEILKAFEDFDIGQASYKIKSFSESLIPDNNLILNESSKEIDDGYYRVEHRTFFGLFNLWEKEKIWVSHKVKKVDPEILKEKFLEIKENFKSKIKQEKMKAEEELVKVKEISIKEINNVREAIANTLNEMASLTQEKKLLDNKIKAQQAILEWIKIYDTKKSNFIN